MSNWKIDAGDIREPSDFDDDLLWRTNTIEDFLRTTRDSMFFIVANKGFGKTFVLKAKSIAYIRKGIHSLHDNVLLDKPGTNTLIFDREKLSLYASVQTWANAWSIAICLAVLKKIKLRPTNISTCAELLLNGEASTTTSILKCVVDLTREELFSLINDYNFVLLPLLEKVSTPLSAFIDNVDEFFEIHLDDSKHAGSSQVGEVNPEVWYYSQAGLVEAIYQLTGKNQHLKLFASIRKEVFQNLSNWDSKSIQIAGQSANLEYSYEDLKEILCLNIRREPESRLVLPSEISHEPLKAFLGFSELPHAYFPDEKEPSFDYICRHTLLRPRDFMWIGKNISNINKSERNHESIRRIVNKSATEIALQYLREIAPHIPQVDFKKLLSMIPTNLISNDQLRVICSNYNAIECDRIPCEKCQGIHAFGYLYKIGLLGVVETDMDTEVSYQHYVIPGIKSAFVYDTLPHSDYYFLHPILHRIINELNPHFRVFKNTIFGYKRVWRDEFALKPLQLGKMTGGSRSPKTIEFRQKLSKDYSYPSCHVHFGAGRLGLGLVVPLLHEQRVRLIVVQRPSKRWNPLKDKDSVTLKSGTKNIQLELIHDREFFDDEYLQSKWRDNHDLLVLSNNEQILTFFIERCGSLSTALGSNLHDIAQILSLSKFDRTINIYPFENDDHMISSFRNLLKQTAININVVSVIADRICNNVRINRKEIIVDCEDYALVVMQKQNDSVVTLFGSSSQILLTHRHEEYEFYRNRKFLMLNCIHMIIAVYSYVYLIESGIKHEKDWRAYHLNVLARFPNILPPINVFLKLQALRLICDTQSKILDNVYPALSISEIYRELISYGNDVLSRIMRSVDKLERVLDTTDFFVLKNKYENRIKEMRKFLEKDRVKLEALSIDGKPKSDELFAALADLGEKCGDFFVGLVETKLKSSKGKG